MLFADFMNHAMIQAGITNYKLAKRLGISQTTVANWLAGTSEPRPKKKAEVFAVFGVNESDLEFGLPEIFFQDELIENEKSPASKDAELDETTTKIFKIIEGASPDKRKKILAAMQFLDSLED